MKIASYTLNGTAVFGAVVGSGLVTLNERLGGKYVTLRDVLTNGALNEVKSAVAISKPDAHVAAVHFLPTIPNPDKVLCLGINYKSHADETGQTAPPYPTVFARLTSTLIGHEEGMQRPLVSDQFDYEGELAIIIGREARHVRAENALSHVAGYTCFNDGSVLDYQQHSVTAGKNFPTSGPLGPWMTTADEIPDPTRLTLTTRLNGAIVQQSGTDKLIYSIPAIIAYISQFTMLVPGDVITTGTPDGVGFRRNPPLWMKSGDTIEVEISGIGTLRNRVTDERRR